MTTSGTTVFSTTARDIALAALHDNAIIPLDEQMEAHELDAVLLRLNSMIKSWQSQGVMWKREEITVNGSANVATVTLPPSVREVRGARYVQSPTNERTLFQWERDDYFVLPNKTSAGTPTIYYRDRQAAAVTLYLWPVPTANFSLVLDVDQAMDTVTDGAQTLDIPEELTETVYSNLAVRSAGLFGAQPSSELVARAGYLERQMLDDWRPAYYSLGRDC